MLRQQMCVSEEVTLLFISILRNFAEVMLCLRDMANLAEIFEIWII